MRNAITLTFTTSGPALGFWRSLRRCPLHSRCHDRLSRNPSPRRAFHSTRVTMKLRSGIVGLPNVGKSTLFNALVEGSQAQAGNFPFCTIEPNVGIAMVPDPRLKQLEKINSSKRVVPTTLEFVDIAGLVAGASKGEGLGNSFLANIRECDSIVHVVRCFDDENIIHVSGSVDPGRDIEVINLELALADMAQIEKRLVKAKAKTRVKVEVDPHEVGALEKIFEALNEGTAARRVTLSKEEHESVKGLGLLTMKPIIYAANVEDGDLASGNTWVDSVRELADDEDAKVVIVSAQVESELVTLPKEDQAEFLESLGVKEGETGLTALVKAAYELLGLRTYFTSGPQETRAWTIKAGMKAPQAAGVIHSDFERGFIRAETINYDQLVSVGSEKTAKESGLIRSEGKEYEVAEGDVCLFRFNV
eukprot:Plantae.Rhodophyta-Hildenbrandia_rubra.ctg10351.p1 GENE.Plantae.Rhodophyta-Hildenbrandia_rubra.ctg10351~~Plantae.Rhodophyta-Hildenbrandia_rubra.ctg10351.p1  ORF type:complete len:419 (-),score=77.38 Plantae.Rhodophyta-Hildenbrandia_rubra.ctg10351:1441-2697(-)